MADEYKAVLTGGLSLKGGLFKNKKKKKGKRRRNESEASNLGQENVSGEVVGSESGMDGADRASEADKRGNKDGLEGEAKTGEEGDDTLTPAQRRFRDKQLQREAKKIRKMVTQTHRERVEEFNALLASMTEHNDIPRCSAAGNG